MWPEDLMFLTCADKAAVSAFARAATSRFDGNVLRRVLQFLNRAAVNTGDLPGSAPAAHVWRCDRSWNPETTPVRVSRICNKGIQYARGFHSDRPSV